MPTSPEEQFYFMMIKQAIERHYWIKERSYYEVPPYTNLCSDHHQLRIINSYLYKLPEALIHNPAHYISENGVVIKSSEGQGEYPNEEISELKLHDGEEIICKKIEPKKLGDNRKEFGVLIAADKAGLRTAKPIGFIVGKEEGDDSYLLMEKLPGVSGRNLEKTLQDAGRDEAYIQSTMSEALLKLQEIAESFRSKIFIDKPWRVKDTMVTFGENGQLEDVVPIDWERANVYDPENPHSIDIA